MRPIDMPLARYYNPAAIMAENRLSRFEKLAQELVEGTFGRLLGSQVFPAGIATFLVRELEASEQQGKAAESYEVFLCPEDLLSLQRELPDLAELLADYLYQAAEREGSEVQNPFKVVLHPDESLGKEEFRVAVTRATLDRREAVTKKLQLDKVRESAQDLHAVDCYLIVNGKRHIPLDRPLLTIGRHMDNDIVVDASSVSRHHAQLRWRYGRFVIYDLGSRGGTFVNGQAVSESVLYAGDVIGVSTISLIYGEDLESGQDFRRPMTYHGDSTTPIRIDKQK
jgi:hypothetical protein